MFHFPKIIIFLKQQADFLQNLGILIQNLKKNLGICYKKSTNKTLRTNRSANI